VPLGVVDESALVRAVDGGGVLFEHDPVLIGTVDVAGAEDHLVAVGDPAGGGVDPVPAVPAVGLRPLEGDHAGNRVPVDHGAGGGEGGGQIGGHLEHAELVLHSGAGLRPAVHEMGAAVLVPQRAGVDETVAGQ